MPRLARAEMPEVPQFLDRRPAAPNAAIEGGDVPDDDIITGIIPTERSVVDIVDPEEVADAITDRLGGGKHRWTADRVNELFAEHRWHVIREG